MRRTLLASVVIGFVFTIGGNTIAAPINAAYTETGSCDVISATVFTHELGDGFPTSPIDENLRSSSILTTSLACVGNDGDTANDWEVTITNLSSDSFWKDLFFVADDS